MGLVDDTAEPVSHLYLGISTGSPSQCNASWNFCWSCMATVWVQGWDTGHSHFCLRILASKGCMAVQMHSPGADRLYISAVQFNPTYLASAQALYLLLPKDLKGSLNEFLMNDSLMNS